jgi:hypothetical protein
MQGAYSCEGTGQPLFASQHTVEQDLLAYAECIGSKRPGGIEFVQVALAITVTVPQEAAVTCMYMLWFYVITTSFVNHVNKDHHQHALL